MVLYLVQHAEAKREEEDPARPLSEKGLNDIRKMAAYLARLDLGVSRIFHSNKLRAEETAAAIFGHLKLPEVISQTADLAPLDDPWIWAERLKDITEDTMLVGHLPHLARLASLLLCGDMKKGIVAFRMAGVVCLKRDNEGAWSLQWMVTPDLIV